MSDIKQQTIEKYGLSTDIEMWGKAYKNLDIRVINALLKMEIIDYDSNLPEDKLRELYNIRFAEALGKEGLTQEEIERELVKKDQACRIHDIWLEVTK